jgi:orotidine-5'-phosphate decarboxylase
LPRAVILVPGYGTQGGDAIGAAASFNSDGLGAIVNASRSITYAYGDRGLSKEAFAAHVEGSTRAMIGEVTMAVEEAVVGGRE